VFPAAATDIQARNTLCGLKLSIQASPQKGNTVGLPTDRFASDVIVVRCPGDSNGERNQRMEREFDLFEKLPDGSVLWKAVVPGMENAVARLKSLGSTSPNEHFAIHTPTKTIVARVNAPTSSSVMS
jgi:hypothetical protein